MGVVGHDAVAVLAFLQRLLGLDLDRDVHGDASHGEGDAVLHQGELRHLVEAGRPAGKPAHLFQDEQGLAFLKDVAVVFAQHVGHVLGHELQVRAADDLLLFQVQPGAVGRVAEDVVARGVLDEGHGGRVLHERGEELAALVQLGLHLLAHGHVARHHHGVARTGEGVQGHGDLHRGALASVAGKRGHQMAVAELGLGAASLGGRHRSGITRGDLRREEGGNGRSEYCFALQTEDAQGRFVDVGHGPAPGLEDEDGVVGVVDHGPETLQVLKAALELRVVALGDAALAQADEPVAQVAGVVVRGHAQTPRGCPGPWGPWGW